MMRHRTCRVVLKRREYTFRSGLWSSVFIPYGFSLVVLCLATDGSCKELMTNCLQMSEIWLGGYWIGSSAVRGH